MKFINGAKNSYNEEISKQYQAKPKYMIILAFFQAPKISNKGVKQLSQVTAFTVVVIIIIIN